MIRFGFACKTLGVPETAVRSLVLARADEKSLAEICDANIRAMEAMAAFAGANRLGLLRLSSDIIPLATHPAVDFDWRTRLADRLRQAGERIARTGLRLSMHPGQYTVLNSPDEGVAERAAQDLAYHADFLDLIGADATARIILHVGGLYGDRKAAIRRFTERFVRLPDNVRSRLVLENDDRAFPVDQVCSLATHLDVPVVFDLFHHRVLPAGEGDERFWLRETAKSWNKESGRQKIHYSQQLPGGRPGSHSRTIGMDAYLEDLPLFLDGERDVMLEVKDKNLSALKCRNLAPGGGTRADLTVEWARYKYAVLEKSPAIYSRIRELLKDAAPDPVSFYQFIEAALAEPLHGGRARNAAEHVWGHVAEGAEPRKKKLVEKALAALPGDTRVLASLKKNIYALAIAQGDTYLMHSLYFVDLPQGP